MRKRNIFVILLFFSLATSVFAAPNQTVDTILNIQGNIPNSTIFFAVDGEPFTGFIDLQPNTTTTLSCWGDAFDLDGYQDLVGLESVIYANVTNRLAPENASILYRNNSCDLSLFDVNGFWNCTYTVQYYAFAADWTCAINITNAEPEFFNDTINVTSEITELIALEVHNSTIDFGLRSVGDEPDTDTEVLVYNTGNVPLNLRLDAFNRSSNFGDDSTQAFNCTIGNIPVDYLRFSVNPGVAFGAATPMVAVGATGTQFLNLAQRIYDGIIHTPTSAPTYWAPGIPNDIAGVCTGRIMYIGERA